MGGACQNAAGGDTWLASGPLQAEDIGFCDNEQALRDLATREPVSATDRWAVDGRPEAQEKLP